MSSTLAQPLAYDAPVAAILTRAADLAEDYEDSTRYLVADAIGAAMGLLTPGDVDFHVTPCVIDDRQPCHPAYRAVMEHLAVDAVQSVWRWSALHGADAVADLLRETALRASTACLSCGVPYGQAHLPTCQFRVVEQALGGAA